MLTIIKVICVRIIMFGNILFGLHVLEHVFEHGYIKTEPTKISNPKISKISQKMS